MSDEKVISLKEKAEESKKEATDTESKEEQKSESFADVMRRNAENKKRMEQERAKANKGVIRSYRLKH